MGVLLIVVDDDSRLMSMAASFAKPQGHHRCPASVEAHE